MEFLIHDRDGKYCPAFDRIIKDAGVTPLKLPAKSPNLNSFCERWVLSVKSECLSKLIFFGEASLRYAIRSYISHYHNERPHQGKENKILFPSQKKSSNEGSVCCKKRLGGLLNYYYKKAA